ncbi:MAG: helix-turn-helix domain-containing protein [Myxococcota bacterium]
MPDRRTRQRQRTAAEIVDAAEELVLDADLDALTVQAIARGVGMTAGALYRYFPGREAIVAAVQARVIRDLCAAVDAAEARPDPLARLGAAGRALLAFAQAQPRRYGLLSRMLAVPHPLVSDAYAAEALPVALATAARIRGWLAAARAEGALAPGDDGVRLAAWWAAVHGAVQLHKLARFTPDADAARVAPAALEALLVGWGADPAAARRALAPEAP